MDHKWYNRIPPVERVKGVRRQQQAHSGLVHPIGVHGGDVIYNESVCFRGELGFLNCDDIYMCVVNKQFVFNSVLIDLKYNEIHLNFTGGSVCLYCLYTYEVVLGLSVRLSWSLCCGCGGFGDCDVCLVVCVGCEHADRV